jgi:nitrite reductase/ring-hydroxylating ferredoxin subunit
MAVDVEGLVRVCSLEDLARDGMRTTTVGGHAVLLVADVGRVVAFDNRCPHMGFPLRRGTVRDGILTCHWHHAKFDLASGCTFDLFADDAPTYRVEVQDGVVWLDPQPRARDERAHWLARMESGLEHDVRLVLAKSALGLVSEGAVTEALVGASAFGMRNRRGGWSPGMTILVAGASVMPALDEADRPLALFHGLLHVAGNTAGQAPLFTVEPLADGDRDPERYREWFREFVEVREGEAAERALISAIGALPPRSVAELVFAAATDHLYLTVGHTLDHINKAFELLDLVGWEHAGMVLPSVVPHLTGAQRMEESATWRHPTDVAAMVQEAARQLVALPEVAERPGWDGHAGLAELVLDGDPARALDEILAQVRGGVPLAELSAAVAYAGALRAVHFPVSNELGDWETVLHGFTYANAVDQALRRAPSRLVARGVLDAAMAVWLERFLNVPRRAIPAPSGANPPAERILGAFDVQGQVDEIGQLVVDALAHGRQNEVTRVLGHAMLREDAEFHHFQMYEGALRQRLHHTGAASDHLLLAAARYLAAHYPTPRGRTQTYDIALRLRRGEVLHGDID